jgi:hypothetical protein
MPIKTFRGQLADGTQDKINLRTNKGKMGYRIVKFQCIPGAPGQGTDVEAVVKVYKNPPASIDETVNFEDLDLLAVIYYQDEATQHNPTSIDVIFDREVFNQNIFITYESFSGSQAMNYYLELEQVPLGDNESTMATLQSIRARYEAYTPAGPS